VKSSGDSAKKAFLHMLEEERAWQELKAIPSPMLSKNRYFIVNTENFNENIDAALDFIYKNWSSFRFRKKSVGALIMSQDSYLFFTYDLFIED